MTRFCGRFDLITLFHGAKKSHFAFVYSRRAFWHCMKSCYFLRTMLLRDFLSYFFLCTRAINRFSTRWRRATAWMKNQIWFESLNSPPRKRLLTAQWCPMISSGISAKVVMLISWQNTWHPPRVCSSSEVGGAKNRHEFAFFAGNIKFWLLLVVSGEKREIKYELARMRNASANRVALVVWNFHFVSRSINRLFHSGTFDL